MGPVEDIQEELEAIEARARMSLLILPVLVLSVQVIVVIVAAVFLLHGGEQAPVQTNSSDGASGEDSGGESDNSSVLRLAAIADAAVRKNTPGQPLGSAPWLGVRKLGDWSTFSLLKFAVPDLGGKEITNAAIRLYVSSDSGDGLPPIQVSTCGTDWEEDSVTWDKRPEKGVLLGLSNAGPTDIMTRRGALDIYIDASGLAGNSTVGLFLQANAIGDTATFHSREAEAKSPTLLLRLQ